MSGMPCPACGSSTGARHVAHERMFGLGDAFAYIECDGCGSLRLLDPPASLERYYPAAYYAHEPSFATVSRMPECLAGMDLSITAPAWMALAVATTGHERAGVILDCAQRAVRHYLGGALPTGSRILDVGSGTGAFVFWLRRLGYAHAVGIDPHVPHDIRVDGDVLVHKAGLDGVEGEWDVILFNHSLEHVADPAAALGLAASRLAATGRCVVRIPIASSHAWERYGVEWVQLDAPRHVFIPSHDGMLRLLDRAGLTVERILYDSGVFQFLGSEAYRRGESLVSPTGELADWGSTVAAQELMELAQQATLLNLVERGDQAAFMMRRRA